MGLLGVPLIRLNSGEPMARSRAKVDVALTSFVTLTRARARGRGLPAATGSPANAIGRAKTAEGALTSFVTLTRARARPWSARCYGVARQRDRSRQNR